MSDGCFDLVLLTQVLEHLPTPSDVLTELHRVLKPGGSLWLTAPLYYPEHEAPYDFYRYTRYGLTHLLGRARFDVRSIDWLEGYLGTLSQHARVLEQAVATSRSGGPTCLAARAACRAVAVSLSYADVRFKITRLGHPKNYAVVAVKPLIALAGA